ncbi:hypothetical protein tb265_16020 [Gemmatimonadetes bacterium T265]|nr:hypothetical protein tb265_16020 [Gemmatimonadetes bacterium T265]
MTTPAVAPPAVARAAVGVVTAPAATAHPATAHAATRAVLCVFVAATFANAALLFLVEPLFSKLVLPVLGGSSAVWTTCMLFYQGVLLAGYAYAHLGARWLGPRRHGALHLALVAASCAALPVALARGWSPPAAGTPVLWLLGLLTVSLGAPFFCLSAGAPLLQRWFAATDHPARHDPYFLYAASNAGSLLALLAYPTLVEPRIAVHAQSRAWSVAYLALGVGLACCAAVVWTARGAAGRPAAADAPAITWRRRGRWLALSAVPSSLLLGVTTHLSTDVAPVPLLWVVPLALYLVTFIWAFARPGRASTQAAARLQTLLVVPLLFVSALALQVPILPALVWHLLAFFVTALVCHVRLAADRPEVGALTAYYVWMSAGGVLGGVVNALVAPAVFAGVYEYPLAMVAGLGLARATLPAAGRLTSWGQDSGVAAGLGLVAWVAGRSVLAHPAIGLRLGAFLLVSVAALGLLALGERPRRFALGAGAVALGFALAHAGVDGVELRARSFYGAYEVRRVATADATFQLLVHGTTVHGAQNVAPARAREPLTYYARSGAVGDLFAALPPRVTGGRVGVVGLGTGSLACYARPGSRWTFFEIDPLIVQIARGSGAFSYLQRCTPHAAVVLGDARVALSRVAPGTFDLLLLDAFTSDAVPTHLLTTEAFRQYARVLAPGGVLAVHVSNKYLALDRVVAGAADALGWTALTRTSTPDAAAQRGWVQEARWIAIARQPGDEGTLASRPGWAALRAAPVAWRDDFANVLAVFRGARRPRDGGGPDR